MPAPATRSVTSPLFLLFLFLFCVAGIGWLYYAYIVLPHYTTMLVMAGSQYFARCRLPTAATAARTGERPRRPPRHAACCLFSRWRSAAYAVVIV